MHFRMISHGAIALLLAVAGSTRVLAQALPDAPTPQVPSDAKSPKAPEPVIGEDGKIVLVKPIPEPAAGDAFFAPLATAGPNTLHRKFKSYEYATFGPRALITPAISSAIRQAFPKNGYPSEWQTGWGAFGRNYGNAVGTKVTVQTTRFAIGALTHEDFRYRPTWGSRRSEQTKDGEVVRTKGRNVKSDKNVGERILYAIGFTFVDRSDDGHLRLAVANLGAAAAGGFVGNAWLPDGFNGTRQGLTRTGSKFGSFALQNVTREFSPEIYKLFKGAHLPFPHLPVPEWWDGSKRKTDSDGFVTGGATTPAN